MVDTKRVLSFREDLCTVCGECFHQCQVMHLPLDIAKKEMQKLIAGVPTEYVLTNCNTCLACNLSCPQQANPYQLILERWNDKYKKGGAPPLYGFVCPTRDDNMWQILNIFLSNQEQRWIYRWMRTVPKPNDTVLLIGNFTHLFPFIIGGSALLDHFTPLDRIDQWEGGAYLYQGGYLDVVQKIARRTKLDFDGWGVKNVVTLLDAVSYFFTEIHPKEMGVTHDQNFSNFHTWLLDKLGTGEILLPNQLDLTITLHDNCYSKALGSASWDPPRQILEKCGCKIIEMKHIKKESLCCGFGAGASWVRNISIPFDMIYESAKKIKEAEETGAKALVSYCGGCVYLLWATRELLRSKIDIYHIVEVVRMSMGEKLNYPSDHVGRAWDIIALITYSLILSLVKRNFYISNITYDKSMSTYQPKRYGLLKVIRYMFNIPIIRHAYSKLFQFLVPFMKTRKF
ncbi:MAG: (Fe-S)-binding protein [Promethearchaeota archaeon]